MIRLIADSTCDLTMQQAKELDVELVPLSIHFDDTIYLDKIDITTETFYEKLAEADALPTTSQANPASFAAKIKPHRQRGDDVIVITIASKLSATMQSALIAAEDVGEGRVYVVDSKSASLGTALLLRAAVQKRDEGKMDAATLAEYLRGLAGRLHIYGVVDTLKYLKMGGRLSASAALVGTVIGIKPIIHVYDGVIKAVGKVRGEAAAMRALKAQISSVSIDTSLGICAAHAQAAQRLETYLAYLQDNFGDSVLYHTQIGSVIGTHTGPGVVAVAFFSKEQ